MAWPKGRNRNTDCPEGTAKFILRLCAEYGFRKVALAAGVSPRAVLYWARGIKQPSLETLEGLIAVLPIITEGPHTVLTGGTSNEALESGTPFGVGYYTLDAANNRPMKKGGEDEA